MKYLSDLLMNYSHSHDQYYQIISNKDKVKNILDDFWSLIYIFTNEILFIPSSEVLIL